MRMNFEEALTYLWDRTAVHVKEKELRISCANILCDPDFHAGYGSSTSSHQHHCYHGGLVIHTAEVLDGALALADVYGADKEILTVAAIWHDTHKTLEYESGSDGRIVKNEYSRLIGHVSGAAMNLAHNVGFTGPDPKLRRILHCLLSHHGRREWGSPVEPATVEAQILHYADMMSMLWGPGRVKEPR